ncbi:hypothetical protein PLICRDRAFT_113702 [Plicaturopsis crispa FD-325 SS-3]|nr:hypothetical protein PLICRDRAFT_113702 [Plicaturopsis crispa FD-325 SS-3]
MAPATGTSSPNGGFLRRAYYVFWVLGVAYGAVVFLLMIPFFQAQVLYAHNVKLPLFSQYDAPEKYGLAPGKTINLNITAADEVKLGAWFVLSDAYYQSLDEVPTAASYEDHIRTAIQRYPTILYFHGNAATRAFSARVQLYKAFSSRIPANVLAIDYRGFGDSEGSPSEAGLALDAHAAWDWAIQKGAKPEDIVIIGHSLGTGVTARLAAELAHEDVHPKGVVLLSPFTSIRSLLDTYNVLGLFPIMKPLASIPGAPALVTKFLVHKFDTLSIVQDIKAPILIAHAENDWDIPYSHSERLFDALFSPLLPTLPNVPKTASDWTAADWAYFQSVLSARAEQTKELVTEADVALFGTTAEFQRPAGGKVKLVKTLAGGHDHIGEQEGVQDIIRSFFF